VILAQGGNQQGYALWLRDGRLFFGVRIDGRLTSIVTRDTVSGRLAITATLNRDGVVQLVVNGATIAEGKASGPIPVQPVDELSIGQDTRTAVGDYAAPYPLHGRIEQISIVAQ
jgi:hypothetical protein